LRLALQVTPNAKKTEPIGVLDGVLTLWLQAPPLEGRANLALVRYLADRLDVPRSAVRVTHGVSNKRKLVEVDAPALTVESAIKAIFPEAVA
jgi:uncharacterized protein YggU (UPF0235/DUF167 family)